eukprot:10629151-Heterocapsa_arctica.AAC.1
MKGGQSTTQIWKGVSERMTDFLNIRAELQLHDPVDYSQDNYERVASASENDWNWSVKILCRGKLGRAVPSWACPRELWRIALQSQMFSDM